MNIWPFSRPPPALRVRQLRREVDQVNIDLVEVREDIEKILAAVKRIQGKTYRRKRADMEVLQPEEAAPDGGEPAAVQPVNGAPPPAAHGPLQSQAGAPATRRPTERPLR